MTVMNASLFAHIQNDFALLGTSGLEGNRFINTSQYLRAYVKKLSDTGVAFPKVYTNILQDTDYLTKIEQRSEDILRKVKPFSEVYNIAKDVCVDVLRLPVGGKLLLPGGWSAKKGGHAMVYQITCTSDGYDFTVINAGAGLGYHAKKSSSDKELYNPIKKWHFTLPKEHQETWNAEMEIFIKRLIEARLPKQDPTKKDMDEKVLYEDILAGISRIGAVEVDASSDAKKHWYTGGQLSGTCTQRCLHQMLKINTDVIDDYKQFIFKFKLHALHEYANDCFTGKQPFSQAVAHQIKIAIYNNLNILNSLSFKNAEVQEFERELTQLKVELGVRTCIDHANLYCAGKQPLNATVAEQIRIAIDNNLKSVNNSSLENDKIKAFALGLTEAKSKLEGLTAALTKEKEAKPLQDIADFTIKGNKLPTPRIIQNAGAYHPVNGPQINFKNGKRVLDNLDDFVNKIEEITDPATRYYYLEQLMLALPVNQLPNNLSNEFSSPFYKELRTLEQYEKFQQHINKIQGLVVDLKNTWLQTAQTPAFNVMVLSAMSLQIDTHQAINKLKGLPSDNVITDSLMYAMVGKRRRDPFLATNNPELDQKFINLQNRYQEVPQISNKEIIKYYQDFIATVPGLVNALKRQYTSLFGNSSYEKHLAIREKGLEALYSLVVMINYEYGVLPEFKDIVAKIRLEMNYDANLRTSVNCILGSVHCDNPHIDLYVFHKDSAKLSTALDVGFLLSREYNKNPCSQHKYLTIKAAANDALKKDTDPELAYRIYNKLRPANNIQIELASHEKVDGLLRITQKDITARDYLHLRSNSELQIPLTLDYFTRNINKLADQSEQEYVEANIFQPGLLSKSSLAAEFLPQLDKFLNTGIRFFSQSGRHTPNSLFYLRLDYQISRYLALIPGNANGLVRLKTAQKELMKQLELSNTPEVTYVLQQTLFLNLMSQIEAGADATDLFTSAMRAHFYLNGQTNPQIFSGVALNTEVAKATACFQQLAARQPENIIINAVKETLKECKRAIPVHLKLKGQYPAYNLVDSQDKTIYEFNAYHGKLFEQKLARSGVPLAIQNHQLIKHLGLQNEKECLMSADGKYLMLPYGGSWMVFLHDQNVNTLTAQKICTIDGKSEYHELLALTKDHSALKANARTTAVETSLPRVLTDGSMEYWFKDSPPATGVLTQNNVPLYSVTNGVIKLLDAKGVGTAYQLKPLSPKWLEGFRVFESADFLIHHNSPTDSVINLPRYNLSFTNATGSAQLIHQQTGEHLVTGTSPIHSKVASLVLKNDANGSRCLIPIARFYATGKAGEESDFYPVVHDVNGTIADACLNEYWGKHPVKETPMWRYQNSEHYVSYQLKNGEPVAETPADGLYLAYLYLSTDQTEKAWKILEECTARLGGLTGSPEELKYISWICNELPHILSADNDKASRGTPPYVACQLKTMALLSDYLQQGGKFNLKAPDSAADTANAQYNLLQHQELEKFLTSFPTSVYSSFCTFQRMRRHLESPYNLSTLERKRLLDYYHHTQKDEGPKGALGYEWMSLNLEALLKERDILLARQKAINSLDPADKKRLDLIQRRLEELKPVTAISTELEQVDINLNLPVTSKISQTYLLPATSAALAKWGQKFPLEPLGEAVLASALKELLSNRGDDTILGYFPAYFEIAISSNEKQKEILRNFCTSTLIAQRHIPLDKQQSNIPLVCNILYRLLENKNLFMDEFLKPYRQSISFSELVYMVSPFTVPPLKVYQAKDVYKDILATPEQLALQPRPVQKPLLNPKIKYQALIIQTGIPKSLALDQSEQLKVALKEFQDLQKASTKAINALGASLKNNSSQQFAIEEQAGLLRLELAKAKNKAAAIFIKNDKLTGNTINAIKNAENGLAPLLEKAWDSALTLANQGPKSPQAARKWRIEKEANARSTLTKADLLALYCRADTATSIEQTGLDSDDAQRLHELIHVALVQGIQQNWLKKISSNLESAVAEKDVHKASMALDLLSRNEISGLENPATVLIQHEQNIVLHDRQVDSLKALLEPPQTDKPFNDLIDKTIPGGGKSKVILPIIAERKATGCNLVVIEVPRSLLATNFVDLNRESQRLFGKKAYSFEFNRDSDSSPKRLEEIYQMFTEIMINKAYLVTAGEAIQSLELKYLELLTQGNKKDENWEKQVYWFDKITSLFFNHADCIIDEAHQGLSIKKKMNYTIGEPQPISTSQAKNTVALYNLIDIGFVKNAPFLETGYNWTPFKLQLATKLVTEASSPLYQFVQKARSRYGLGIDNELIDYLTNQANKQHEAITSASEELKSALGLFKQQINVILPQTLARKLGSQYGSSKLSGLSPIEKTLAIPYEGNDTPSERSRFGNTLEASNYMIQMMLIYGLSKELIQQQVAEWLVEARKELFQNKSLKDLDQTSTAKGIALLVPGLKLSQINADNPDYIDRLHKILQHNRSLINQKLEPLLKQIKNDAGIIHGDSFNHVDLYRTTQAISGTPNPTTYHQRLDFDSTVSLGTDGYVTNITLDKQTATVACDFTNVSQFLESILSSTPDHARCRAIIDINATFTGKTSDFVVGEIAQFILKYPERLNTTIKHILYFKQILVNNVKKDVLCAIDPKKPEEPIILGTSDPGEIDRILGSKPDERFTYYDQSHTVGTDIKQGKNSHALVLVDDRTSLQGFIQGGMRMRELALDQTLELIVPKRNKSMNCKQWIQQFAENDKKDLYMDNLYAAKAGLTNYLRRNLLTRIQDLPSNKVYGKRVLAQHFRSFFIEAPSDDLFELYGALGKEQTAIDILNRSYTQLLARWNASLRAAGISPSIEEQAAVDATLKKIIAKALPHCLPKYEGLNESLSLEVEVQLQKEVQKQVQVELQILNEVYNPFLTSDWVYSWKDIEEPFADHQAQDIYGDLVPITSTLNEVCGFNDDTNLFSQQLIASRNFAYNYWKQRQALGVYLKPVFLIWYHLDKDNKLQAMVVTPQEAEELTASTHMSTSWLSTTQDTLIAGKRPDNILLTEPYQRIREQVRFFNGEFNLLVNQETPLLWLKEKPVEKIKFFEEKLLPYRAESGEDLGQLKIALCKGELKGFNYIAKHPFEDLTQYDWRILDPDLVSTQIHEYEKLAQAFNYLNTHWMTLPDDNNANVLTQLQADFQLPIGNLTYLNEHLQHLNQIKKLFDSFNKPIDKPFLLGSALATKKDQDFFEESIGISVKALLAKYGVNNPAQNNLSAKEQLAYQLASVQSLSLLRQHAAVYDKKPIDQVMQAIAKQTQAVEVLLLLAETSESPKELLTNVLNNSACTAMVRKKVLEAANETVLINLVNNEPVSKDLILANEFMTAIVDHPKATDKVINAVINKGACTFSVLELMLKKASEQVLITLVQKEFRISGLPSSVINHPNATDQVMAVIIKLGLVSSPTQALDIIKQKPNKINADVLAIFAVQIFQQCQRDGPKSSWNAPFTLLVSQALANPDTKDLMVSFFKEKINSIEDVKHIVELLGKDVVKDLPMKSIISNASQQDITVLEKLKLGKDFFSDEVLLLISDKVVLALNSDPVGCPKEWLNYLSQPTTEGQFIKVLNTFLKLGSNKEVDAAASKLFLNENSRTDKNEKNLLNFMRWLGANPAFINPYLAVLTSKITFKLKEFMELAASNNANDNKNLINAMSLMVADKDWEVGNDYLNLVKIGAIDNAKRYLSSRDITNDEIRELKEKCETCIKAIIKNSWGPGDFETSDYCNAMKGILENLDDSLLNKDKFIVLSHKLQQLKETEASVSSEEMKLVRKEFERLEKGGASFFGYGYKNKINEINQAVFNVPLNKRAHIFSNENDPTCNAVRQSLALRRASLVNAIDKEGHVDVTKAAASFKNIKEALKSAKNGAKPAEDEVQTKGIK